jgi:hypothetical protein
VAHVAGAGILLDAKSHGTLIDDRFIGPGAAEMAKANAWLKDHPIPETFSMDGAGPRVCDELTKDEPADRSDADKLEAL